MSHRRYRRSHPATNSGGVLRLLPPADKRGMPSKNWDLCLADPPWAYYGSGTKPAAAGKHYNLMSDEDLLNLSLVPDLLAPHGVFFCWATGPRLDFAIDLIRAWGLTPRGVAFVWVKTQKDGTPIGAQGVRPSITKPTTEFVLAASRVKKGRPMPLASEAVPQVVLAPRGAHSAKPDEVQDRIEQMYPNAAKLEVFARRQRPGWDIFGDQIPRDLLAPGTEKYLPEASS